MSEKQKRIPKTKKLGFHDSILVEKNLFNGDKVDKAPSSNKVRLDFSYLRCRRLRDLCCFTHDLSSSSQPKIQTDFWFHHMHPRDLCSLSNRYLNSVLVTSLFASYLCLFLLIPYMLYWVPSLVHHRLKICCFLIWVQLSLIHRMNIHETVVPIP